MLKLKRMLKVELVDFDLCRLMYSFNAMLPQICPRSLLSDFVLRHILRSDHICVMRCGLEVDRVLLLQASAVCGEALLVVLAGPCHSKDSMTPMNPMYPRGCSRHPGSRRCLELGWLGWYLVTKQQWNQWGDAVRGSGGGVGVWCPAVQTRSECLAPRWDVNTRTRMSNRCVYISTIFSILCTAMIYIYIHIYIATWEDFVSIIHHQAVSEALGS